MKSIVLTLLGIISFSFSLGAQKQSVNSDVQSGKKILVAYFSCTGTTEKVANAIVEVTGGKPYKITPADSYTSADLNWKDKNSRSSREMSDEQSRPVLSGDVLNVKDYDIVFLGYPIWWNLCPRPINTFIEKYDFSGKTIIPFATSGSSSITNSIKYLKKLYPQIKWGEGKLLNNGTRQAKDWAKQIIK